MPNKPEPRPLTYLHSAIDARRRRRLWEQIETWCLFLGYPRSGGTLLEGLLNAHQHAAICHELHVMDFFRKGYSEEQLYALVLQCDRWFGSRNREWSGYDYRVPNQWQGRTERLRVIGDKRGSGTARLLSDYPDLLDRFLKSMRRPVRFIHALRNPFDTIATMERRGRGTLEVSAAWYFVNSASIQNICRKLPPEQVLLTRHEELTADAPATLARLCEFLGLETNEEYLRDCASLVRPVAHRSRDKANWTPEVIRNIERRMRDFEFLSDYSFES
ncbi:MAG: sulfotransferase family protein [Actinomycetota bacterium]